MSLLLILLLLPFAGAVVIGVLGAAGGRDSDAKLVGMFVSVGTLVVAAIACGRYHNHGAVFQFTSSHEWIAQFGARFSLGADGISLPLITLTALLTPVVLLAGWHTEAVNGRRSAKTYVSLLLMLEGMVIGVFAATDVFLFYVFFEAMLIPMYFLIGSYGGPRRQYAAVKFLLYSLVGGLLMLAAVLGLFAESAHQLSHGTFDFATLTTLQISPDVQRVLFLGFFIAFAVKAPLFPFHTWLPDAGAEAPTGAAVLLVGVMDKVGTFGFLRYCIPLFPQASREFAPMVLGLGLAGVLYGALVAIGQRDMKRLVSYTSVAHFGFIAVGTFALTSQGVSGGVLYMVNHGLSTGLLFLAVGFLAARAGTRDSDAIGGIQKVTPVLAGILLIAGLSSLALPGMNSFVSEFLVLVGTFSRYQVVAILATLGIVLAALYILVMYQKVAQGPIKAGMEKLKDLTAIEIAAVSPLVLGIVVLGVYPKPILDMINPSVTRTLVQVDKKDPAYRSVPGATSVSDLPDIKTYGPGTSPFLPVAPADGSSMPVSAATSASTGVAP